MSRYVPFGRIVTAAVVLTPLLIVAQSTTTGAPQKPAAAPISKRVAPQNKGERIFQQNCSRCHSAPQAISPRISGTVLRHMRVRASLSAQDEQELMRFFNP